MKHTAAYVQAFIKVQETTKEPIEDMLEELLKLVIEEACEMDVIGKLMVSIDECLEESQVPEQYYQVNPFYVEQGLDDPYEVAVRLHEKLESVRLDLSKLRVAPRSYKKAMGR